MTVTRKDATATVLTLLAVLTYPTGAAEPPRGLMTPAPGL